VLLYSRMGQSVKVSKQPTQRHRGADPEDERSFGAGRLPYLRQAVHDVCWLLDRGYGIASATELAGDRYHLTRRQRIAVARCSCSATAKERRQSHCVFLVAVLVLISWAFTSCGVRDDKSGTPARGTNGSTPTSSTPLKSGDTAQVLLFNGTGTSPNDVKAFETLLKGKHVDYSKVNSWQLNAMSESQMRAYGLLIVPGGNFIDIGNGLTAATTANIRNAVQNGLNYLGVCAGAFLAGNSPPNGLNLTSGVRFGFYAAEDRGIRKAVVPIAVAGSPTLEHYWEDGPQLSGWGTVVGKYPDGTPAIVEGTVGSGWVLLCGVHPEAPTSWRRGMTFTTPVTSDNAYAWTLIHAALDRESLPHY
jgi:hypothetical protein